MSDNGKLKLSDYGDISKLPDWQQEKIRKAVAKRQRRRERERRKREAEES